MRLICIYSDHSSHRDSEDRYRDRDSRSKPSRGGYSRSSSFNRYTVLLSYDNIV